MTQSSAALKAPSQETQTRTIEITDANRGFGPNNVPGPNVTLSFNGQPRTAHVAVTLLAASGIDIDTLRGRVMEVEMSRGRTGLYQIERILTPERC